MKGSQVIETFNLSHFATKQHTLSEVEPVPPTRGRSIQFAEAHQGYKRASEPLGICAEILGICASQWNIVSPGGDDVVDRFEPGVTLGPESGVRSKNFLLEIREPPIRKSTFPK